MKLTAGWIDFMNQGQDLRTWTPGADAEEMVSCL